MATIDNSRGGRDRRAGVFTGRDNKYPSPDSRDSLSGDDLEMAGEQGREQDETAATELRAAIESGEAGSPRDAGSKEATVEDIMRWSDDEIAHLTQLQLDEAIKVLKKDRDKKLYPQLRRAVGGEKSRLFALLNARNIQNIKLLEARARFDPPIDEIHEPDKTQKSKKWYQFWKKK